MKSNLKFYYKAPRLFKTITSADQCAMWGADYSEPGYGCSQGTKH